MPFCISFEHRSLVASSLNSRLLAFKNYASDSSFCFSLNLSHPCFCFLEIKLVVKKGDLEDLVLTRLRNFPSSSRSASRLEGLVEKLQDLRLDQRGIRPQCLEIRESL